MHSIPYDKKTIYLIDDDMDILTILRLFFEQKQFNVITDYNGYLLNLNNDEKPAIYLIDVNLLEGKSGIQLCRTIKNRHLGVPVLLMSADPAARKIAHDCGADDFITKPFVMETLLESINQLTDNYSV